MTKIITTTPRPIYKFLPLLIVLYFCIAIIGGIGFNKYISLGNSYAQAGTIIFPLFFILSDIIAEVYGYKIARLVFWSTLIGLVTFAVFSYLIVQLPYPAIWHGEESYQFVFAHILRIEASTAITLSCATIVNIYLITKWKILMRGRYFWLRSLASSTIGEFIYTALNIFIITVGIRPFKDILTIIVWAYLFKVIYTVIFAYPAVLAAAFLKRVEKCDAYDYGTNFNPFRWSS